MVASTDLLFLTTSQQKIMLLIYNQKEVTFETQTVFKCKKWFREEMQKLLNFDKIERHNGINLDNLNKRMERYTLTFTGKMFVEKFILDYNEANKKETD